MKFGGGPDLYIVNNCDREMSEANIGHTYQTPNGMKYGSEHAKTYLAGAIKF